MVAVDNQMKIKLASFIKKVSGISTPLGGIEWVPDADERKIIYALIQNLGNRRLIRHYHGGFEHKSVIESCNIIRSNLTDALAGLSPESAVRETLEDMRTVFHLFQTLIEEEYPPERFAYRQADPEAEITDDILLALDGVRDFVGSRLSELSKAFEIPLSSDIAYDYNLEKIKRSRKRTRLD